MPENAANRSASPAADQGTELTAQRWRVSPASAVFKGIGALAFALAALLFAADPIRVLVAGAAAALLAGYALRDLLAPVRLAADSGGVTVISGYAGHRHLSWAQVERVRLDRRSRLGMRSELLEIDAGDSLHLFGASDLNAPVAEVADALGRIRYLTGSDPEALADPEASAGSEASAG